MLVCPRCRSVYVGQEKCGLDGTRLIRTSIDPLLGQRLGAYTLSTLLAEGRTGRVYRGDDGARSVAVKVLYGDIARDRKLASRWVQHARAAGRGDQELVWPVLDAGISEPGLAYVVRELAPHGSLADALRIGGARPPKSAARLVRQIAAALAKLHTAGTVFEDLRPHAVLLDGPEGRERGRLSEPGQVGLLRSASPPLTALMSDGRFFQYPAYLSPEQVNGEAATARSDLYALGVILYELLVGVPPFADARAHVSERVREPKLSYMGLSEIALRLLEKETGRRPASAAAVVVELDRLGLLDSDVPAVALPPRADQVRLSNPPRAPTPLPGHLPTPQPVSERSNRLPVLMAILALGTGGALLWRFLPGAPAAQPVLAQLEGQDAATQPPDPADSEADAAQDPAGSAPAMADAPRPSPVVADAGRAPVDAAVRPSEPRDASLARAAEARDAGTPRLAAGKEDAGFTEFQLLDHELGRALAGAGLVWEDLAQADFETSRRWGRWYKSAESPSSEELRAVYDKLITVIDRAKQKKVKTSTRA